MMSLKMLAKENIPAMERKDTRELAKNTIKEKIQRNFVFIVVFRWFPESHILVSLVFLGFLVVLGLL
jgi:hypothetical protein